MARKYAELRARMTAEQRTRSAALAKKLNDELPLHQLRLALQLTQEQLAESLGVTQASISKMEKQEDMLITTLQRMVRAMGGELELRAHFPQGDVTLKDLGKAA